ncbi:MAG: S46 family peptidase [Flavobacteriaceae bacterium]|nr:S46 family peptidase [Flavobacteriaceae bacterium]
MRKITSYVTVLLVVCSMTLTAQIKSTEQARNIQGGMWIPSLLKGMNEDEMQLLGSKMSAEDIYSVNHSSLKDAIAQFGNGCTSEVISNEGLLLTNHHCGYGSIQAHSSVEHDYLKDGFWAKTKAEELPTPGMTATFINRIDDVTTAVLEGVTDTMTEQEKQARISQNIVKVRKNAQKEEWQDIFVRSFYKGNQYFLFVVETFKDVRFVGAPPSSIGKFGADTDNWMWPRHTADFSIFRIYANKDNRPAEYSKDNVPYTPKHFLPISLSGVEEGDFTLVFGFPGRTNEYLPAIGIEQIVNVSNPARIAVREEALKIVGDFMKKSPELRIKYASKFASVANYWKKWKGENQGIERSKAIEKRKEMEQEFSKIVEEKDLQGYKTILSDFEKQYKEIKDLQLAYDYWSEIAYRNTELLKVAFYAYILNLKGQKNKEHFDKIKKETLKNCEDLYKNFSLEVDKKVFVALMKLYNEKVPKEFIPENFKNTDFKALADDIYTNSKLTSLESIKELFQGTPEEVQQKLANDKGYQFAKQLHEMFLYKVNPAYSKKKMEISATQKKYMKALMEVFPNKRFFPDANSTLRVNYGRVEGYEPKDGIYYLPKTYLNGVVAKHKEGDYEFHVPQKLRNLYATKDFGMYAENGKMPVNVLTTNHMTGGNSGSPILDAQGNMIGLAFDTTWEGTMSDLHFDAEIVRSIMVDIRYVLFIIDKYAEADNLIKELKIVYPKK